MAATKPMGTLFLDTDLDLTKAEQKLQALHKRMVDGATKSEEAFKSLGTASDRMFEAQKKVAYAAYEAIEKKAQSSADEIFRLQSALTAKINTLNNQMTKNPLYETLGVKSQAAIEAQKTAVVASYEAIKNSGIATAQDLINIEAAKNEKLIALSNELNAVQLANDKKRLQEAQAIAQAETNNQKAKVAEAQALAQGQINAQQKVENERARIAQLNADSVASQKAIQEGYWTTLGIRSTEAIKKEIDTVKEAATAKQSIYDKGSQDWINIERAKNAKLKELNKEMVGEHEMSMASMTRAVLRFYAAWYVGSAAAQVIAAPFIKGFEAVEQYNTAVASMAAMVITFGDKTREADLSKSWKEALAYSTAIVPVLEQIAARTLLSGQETIALANAFARSGVFLDANNAKQIEGFTRISNALPLMTQGQEIMRQINTEVRSLMLGSNEQTSMMLTTLKAIDPQLEEHLKKWRLSDTVLENIGRLLEGFGPATDILDKQWQAVKSTIDTTATQILRAIMKPTYEDIIDLTKDLNSWLVKNKDEIVDMVTKFRIGLIDIQAEYLRLTMLGNKIGGTITAAKMGLYGVGAAIGNESSVKRFEAAAEANIQYEKTYEATDKKLEALALKQINLENTLTQSYKDQQKELDKAGSSALTKKSATGMAVQLTLEAQAETQKMQQKTYAGAVKEMNDQISLLKSKGASEVSIENYTAAQKAFINQKYHSEINKGARAAAKDQKNILEGNLTDVKAYYDEAIAKDNQWHQEQKDNGMNSVDLANEYYTRKNADLKKLYDDQRELINNSGLIESEKYKKLKALDKTYTDGVSKNQTELNKELIVAANQHLSVMADAYRTLGDYSETSIQVQIEQIEKLYKIKHAAVKKGSQDEIDLEKAKQFEIFKLRNNAEKTLIDMQLSYLETIKGPYSEEYKKVFEDSLKNQAALLELQYKNAGLVFNKEAWILEKQQENNKKELSDKANFYSSIEGYAEQAYQKKLQLIELERQANIKANGDVEAANAKANQSYLSAYSEKIDAEQKWSKTVISGLGSMLDAAKTCYAEDSYEYNRINDMKKGILMAELALEAVKNASILANMASQSLAMDVINVKKELGIELSATEAILTQGSGDPYTAFARIAAMIGLVASVLGAVGISKSFGSSGGSSSASTETYTGQSTVLGASDSTGSESISKAWELLQDTYDMEYEELSGIYSQMKDLNANITGLVTSIVRTGGVNDFNIETGYEMGSGENIINNIKNTTTGILDYIPGKLLSEAVGWIWDGIGSIASSIFGGGTETSITGTGIATRSSSVASLLAGGGVNAQQYVGVHEHTDGGWFSSDSDSYYTIYNALDQNVSDMMDKVFVNMGTTIVELAKGLGTDVDAALGYVFEGTQINLQGMDTETISKTLTEYFSNIGDKAVETLFGGIVSQYQEVGEGMMETASRLVTDKAVVLDTLDMTGKAFVGSAQQAIALSESLINLAGDLETLRDNAESFFKKFYSEAEQQTYLQDQLTEAMKYYNLALPTTREGYRNIVEALDLTTDSGKNAYVALLGMSESADAYYSYLEDAAKEAADKAAEIASSKSDMEIEILKLEGKTAEATALERAKELAAMDESLRPLQERIYALNDETDAAEAAATATEEALTTAKTNLEAAFSAEKEKMQSIHDARIEMLNSELEAAQSNVDTIKDSYDRLKSARESMGLTDFASTQSNFTASQSILAQTLAKVKNGNLSAVSEMSDAVLETLTSSDNMKYFGSAEQYKASYYQIYNALSEMETLTGSRLSAAEQTVNLLQDQIDQAEDNFDTQMTAMDNQLEAILGTKEAVLSVAAAINEYYAAKSGTSASATTTSSTSTMNVTDNVSDALSQLGYSPSDTSTVGSVTAAIEAENVARQKSAIQTSASLAYIAAVNSHASKSELDRLSAIYAAAQAEAIAALDAQAIAVKSVRGYDFGGIASGPESGYEATLHGTELIVSPKKGYPATVVNGDNAELIAEAKALRQEVAELRRTSRESNRHLEKLGDWCDNDNLVTT